MHGHTLVNAVSSMPLSLDTRLHQNHLTTAAPKSGHGHNMTYMVTSVAFLYPLNRIALVAGLPSNQATCIYAGIKI